MGASKTHEGKTLLLEMTSQVNYIIHPTGYIERTDRYQVADPNWQLRGLVRRRDGSGFVPIDQISPEWLASVDVTKYAVEDIDHGTARQWGDGVQQIRFYDREQDTDYYRYVREERRLQSFSPTDSWGRPVLVIRRDKKEDA